MGTGEAAERRHLIQPLVAAVGPRPVEAPLLRLAETARLPHPVSRLRAQRRVAVRAGHPAVHGRRVRRDPAEGRAHRLVQLGRRQERVPEHGQPPARAQRLCRLGRARHRIHPVPGLPGDDRVEMTARRIPGLDRGYLDLDSAAPGLVGHPPVGINPEHLAAGRLEQPGGDAGPAADVEKARAGADGDDPVHQGVRVAGPGAVVARGIRAERLRHFPVLMRLTGLRIADGARGRNGARAPDGTVGIRPL